MINDKCLNKVKRMIDIVKTLYYYIHINNKLLANRFKGFNR